MGQTDDIASLLGRDPEADVGFHQGVIEAWDEQTGNNIINMVGTNLVNLPMLNITEALVLRPGHVVGLLRFKNSYFILGRIVLPGSADFFSGVMPDISFPLWPTNTDAALQTANIDSNYYPKWAGGYIVNHPQVSFAGTLNLSGGAASTGNWRVRWYLAHPGNGANPPNGTDMFVSTVSITPLTENGTYTWPAGLLGTLVFVSFEARCTAGAPGDWAAVEPNYLYGHGLS